MSNLFLDDLRTVDMVYPGQTEHFVVVHSYTAFVKHGQEYGLPSFISFDNDLGEDEEGVLCLRQMAGLRKRAGFEEFEI